MTRNELTAMNKFQLIGIIFPNVKLDATQLNRWTGYSKEILVRAAIKKLKDEKRFVG